MNWKKRIRPVKDYVAVTPLNDEEVSKGGIVIVEGNEGGCRRGRVFAVGPDGDDELIGMVVVYVAGHAANIQDLTLEGEKYSIVEDGAIQHILLDEFDEK